MRIIMLGWELPPHNSGGLGIACYGLCEALSKSGADIEFILPYTADHTIDFMKIRSALPTNVTEVNHLGNCYESYKYIHHDNSESWHDLFSHQLAYEQSIEQLTFQEPFDVIHAHDWLTFRAALKLRQLYDKPVFLHVHSIEADRAGGNGGNPLVREIEETSLHMADKIIAVSEHTKKQIIKEYDIPADAIEVIHNSISPNLYASIKQDENSYRLITALKQQGYKVIVNIGRLTIQKGLTNLVRAFEKVHQFDSKTVLLIAGSGEQKNELLELSAELGVSANVLFVDFVRGKKWRDTYTAGDIFVMPSISEPFGLTPLESILHGTPAIVSKQSGVAEVVSNILKVDYWDVNKLASQIINVFAYPQLANELQRNALIEVQAMGWHHVAEKVTKTYQKLIPTGAAL